MRYLTYAADNYAETKKIDSQNVLDENNLLPTNM
jgi:hypothetical protein